ncbi:hypothetical protein ACJX0J_037578 [Zea mays]
MHCDWNKWQDSSLSLLIAFTFSSNIFHIYQLETGPFKYFSKRNIQMFSINYKFTISQYQSKFGGIQINEKYPSAFFIMEGLDAGTYKNMHVINGKIFVSLLIAFTLDQVKIIEKYHIKIPK